MLTSNGSVIFQDGDVVHVCYSVTTFVVLSFFVRWRSDMGKMCREEVSGSWKPNLDKYNFKTNNILKALNL